MLILIVSLLSLGICKKICDMLFPTEMNKFYIQVCMYGLNAYGIAYTSGQHLRKLTNVYWRNVTNKMSVITFIKNGHELKECNLTQLSLLVNSCNNYDVILYTELNDIHAKYEYNVVRIDKRMLCDPIITASKINLLSVQVCYKGINYIIDFGTSNYYICGNILFDKAFIKWYLNHAYGVIIAEQEEYTCTIMDQNVNVIILRSSNYMLIELDRYVIGEIVREKDGEEPVNEVNIHEVNINEVNINDVNEVNINEVNVNVNEVNVNVVNVNEVNILDYEDISSEEDINNEEDVSNEEDIIDESGSAYSFMGSIRTFFNNNKKNI